MKDQIDLSKMQSIPVVGASGQLRLHRYWKEPDGDMWDEIWKNTNAVDYWYSARAGKLEADYERLFMKYLLPFRPNLEAVKILEAGCGVGQVAVALRARGFDCYGLDYAEKTIKLLNKQFPDYPFHKGDIRNLPYADASFDAYISLGVIEHFVEGQDVMLQEAARIIKPGGYIFISVPALNGYRKLKCRMGRYKDEASAPFFESCLSVEELYSLCISAGFKPIEHSYQNTVMTFAQETLIRPLYYLIEDIRYVRGIIDRFLRLILPKSWFGHMVMVVAQRTHDKIKP